MESIKIIIIAVFMATGLETFGQEKPKNTFGLVYANAITENKANHIQIHPLSYTLNGITIAANVYTPADYNKNNQYPTIVIAHPNGGVKEQVAGLYAQQLAAQGFITIVADAAYQGASAGLPRHVDKPASRIADIQGMADYISQYPGVDPSRLGLLGICGGGGYALKAAQGDKRFKAIATLSMFNSGEVRRNGFQGSQKNTIQDRLLQASNARNQEMAGGEITYMGSSIPSDEEIAKIPTDLYREGYGYYYKTHAHPNSTFKYTMSSLIDLMSWDATDQLELLEQPLLMIAGNKADSKYMSDNAFAKAINSKQKELFLLDGATHIDTYWKPTYVDQIVKKSVDFFTTYL